MLVLLVAYIFQLLKQLLLGIEYCHFIFKRRNIASRETIHLVASHSLVMNIYKQLVFTATYIH